MYGVLTALIFYEPTRISELQYRDWIQVPSQKRHQGGPLTGTGRMIHLGVHICRAT